MIRIGFGGPVYYKYHKEPPKIVLVIFKKPLYCMLEGYKALHFYLTT